MTEKICLKCGCGFKCRQIINGKKVSLYKRKYCLDCSPYGQHNTAKLEKPKRKRQYSTNISEESRKKNRCKTRAWRRWIKKHLIQYKGDKCEKCGYNKPYLSSYDFHHLDPADKDFNISRMSNSRDLAALEREVEKCILVCRNCHAELHEDEYRHEIDESLKEYNRWLIKKIQQAKKREQEQKDGRRDENGHWVDFGKKICLVCDNEFTKRSAIQKYCSPKCSFFNQRKTTRPTREELQVLIDTKSFCAIGRQFGVSDNAIRKWARVYNLLPSK